MSDWIDSEVAKIKGNDEARQLLREQQVRLARLVEAQAPGIWDRLAEETQFCVHKINSRFYGDECRQIEFRSHNENRFSISNNCHPIITVESSLNLPGQCIDINITNAKSLFLKSKSTTQIQFFFNMTATSMKMGDEHLPTVETACKKLLDFVLRAFTGSR
jgi:hypothetical protein